MITVSLINTENGGYEVFTKYVKKLNGYGGVDTPSLQVLKMFINKKWIYYIGTLKQHTDDGVTFWVADTIVSKSTYDKREDAEKH